MSNIIVYYIIIISNILNKVIYSIEFKIIKN